MLNFIWLANLCHKCFFSLFVDQNVGNASTSMDFRTYYSIVLLTQGKTGCFYYRLHVKQAYEWENHCLTWTSHSRQIFRLMFIWFCSNMGCCSQKYNKTCHFDLTVCFQIWSFHSFYFSCNYHLSFFGHPNWEFIWLWQQSLHICGLFSSLFNIR